MGSVGTYRSLKYFVYVYIIEYSRLEKLWYLCLEPDTQMFNKFMKTLSSMHKEEKGMAGLATAIILIAFVTVAAVFSYAVLSAGLYSPKGSRRRFMPVWLRPVVTWSYRDP